MLLQVNNLSISFDNGEGVKLPVVSDVSFSVDHGEILALVGESGCGKTQSCLSLARLLQSPPAYPQVNSVLFTGKDGDTIDISKLSDRQMRSMRGGKIAYIFQEPATSLNPVFRVEDQIAEVLELHRPNVEDFHAEIVSLLRKVGIPDPEARSRAYPHELSGGMQQRIMIAMALAGNPELLVADEPTTALDVTIQAQILDLLDDLRRQRDMAVILVTHNLGIVSQLADKVAVMYAGTIVESGKTRDVIDNPLHPYTQALLRAVPRLRGTEEKLQSIPGTVPQAKDFPQGCRFCDRCPFAAEFGDRCENQRPQPQLSGDDHFCACFKMGCDN